MNGIEAIDGYRVVGPGAGEQRVPVVSVVHERVAADRLAFALDRRYHVASRSGLHCAPWAHRALGTFEVGALRLSIGYGLTSADVDHLLGALEVLGEELSRP